MVRAASRRRLLASVGVSDPVVWPRGPDAAGCARCGTSSSAPSTAIAVNEPTPVVSCLSLRAQFPPSRWRSSPTIDEVSGERSHTAAASAG